MALSVQEKLNLAADWLRAADGLLVTAGAGMGVDSGLPDFRGRAGFWRAYPVLKPVGINFEDIASPDAMRRTPTLAWGFYGHMLGLYRKTEPHDGFNILRHWAERMEHGLFVFTSNVDGHFQKAGYPDDRIVECHGSIHFLQCFKTCSRNIWSANMVDPQVDANSCRLQSDIPTCPKCGAMARPNVLMFDDYDWIDDRTDLQQERMERWLSRVSRLVVVELGAGKAIPTVRMLSEKNGPRIIRINPRDFAIASYRGVGIPGRALEVLGMLNALLVAG